MIASALAACSLFSSSEPAPSPPAPPPPAVDAPVATEGAVLAFGATRFRMGGGLEAVAFGPEATWMVMLDDVGGLARFSLPAGEPQALTRPCETAQALTLSPDGTRMAVSCDWDDVRIVALDGGAVLQTIDGTADRLRWSSDGRVLAISSNGRIRWVELASGRVLARLQADYYGDWDERKGLWVVAGAGPSLEGDHDDEDEDEGEGNAVVALVPGEGERWRKEVYQSHAAAISLDGGSVAVLDDEGVHRLDAATGARIVSRDMEDEPLVDIVATRSGWWASGESHLFTLDDRMEVVRTLPGTPGELQVDAGGAVVAVVEGSRPGVWTHDGTDLAGEDGLSGPPVALQISADGGALVALGEHGVLVKVDRATGVSRVVRVEPQAGVLTVSADGRWAAIRSYDEAWLVDTTKAEGSTRRLQGLPADQGVGFLAFSPDGATLWVVTSGEELELCAVDTATATSRSRRTIGHGLADNAAVSADGAWLALPGEDGTLRMVAL